MDRLIWIFTAQPVVVVFPMALFAGGKYCTRVGLQWMNFNDLWESELISRDNADQGTKTTRRILSTSFLVADKKGQSYTRSGGFLMVC